MNRFAISLVAFAFVFFVPSLGRADIVYAAVNSFANGEAYVTGFTDDHKVQYINAAGTFASVSGSSGSGSNLATYSAALNQNLGPATVTASGSFNWSFSTATQALKYLQAGPGLDVHFQVATAQSFTVSGSGNSANFFVHDATTNVDLFNSGFLFNSSQTVSGAGVLIPGQAYWFYATTNATWFDPNPVPPESGSNSGTFQVTFTTSAVPEPSSLCLVGFAASGMAGYFWRRRVQSSASTAKLTTLRL